MEGDEMEMTREELQMWIREQLEETSLISPDLLEKCDQLRSLLNRKEKLSASFLNLTKYVDSCEAIVKKQYSMLGWEYKDTDSDDAEKSFSSESPSLCPTESETFSEADFNDPLVLKQEHEMIMIPEPDNQKKTVKKELRVVLTRLSSSQISAMTSHYHSNDDENIGDTEMQQEPKDKQTDSDYSLSNSKPNKRRKLDHRYETQPKSVREKKGRNITAIRNRSDRKTSTPKAKRKFDANTTSMKGSKLQANTNTDAEIDTTQTQQDIDNANNTTSTQPAVLKEECKAPHFPTLVKVEEEISVNMEVIARRKTLVWQYGTVEGKVTKEDGSIKYNVCFKDEEKSLVSSHHIASQNLPKANKLFVGGRVVVKLKPDDSHFTPGILAELPGRKNRMRFLILCDNEMPIYVGLQFFHQVCQPLENPLDDIKNKYQKKFMTEYVSMWPYPPQMLYSVGQHINVLYEEKQQRCDVLEVDCSLVRVRFQSDEHQEWLYRGSWRLEHLINMRQERQKREKKTSE